MPFISKEDLLAIENVLYEVEEEELVARQFLNVNTNFPAFAAEIGYDWYDRTGSAAILASGASAKDVPFVGEKGGREVQKVYSIVTGIKYTKAEMLAAQARATLGKGVGMSLDTTRVETARRYIAETENRLAFIGDKKFGVKGLLNHPGIQVQTVAEGAKGTNANSKRLWANKTQAEILEDLRLAKAAVEKGNIFKARVLILSSDLFNILLRPFSEHNPMTIYKWLQSEGVYFENIIQTSNVSKEHNGFSDSSDCFVVLDNNKKVVELAVPQDMELGNPVYDILENSEQAVEERTAGCIIRHPSAIYVAKGA